jgi:hypothetical protein
MAKMFAAVCVIIGFVGIWLEHQSAAIKQGIVTKR